jgi:hypothetical protein
MFLIEGPYQLVIANAKYQKDVVSYCSSVGRLI